MMSGLIPESGMTGLSKPLAMNSVTTSSYMQAMGNASCELRAATWVSVGSE